MIALIVVFCFWICSYLFCSIIRTMAKISCWNLTTLTPKTLHALSITDLVHLEVSITAGGSMSCEFGWPIPYQGRESVSQEEIPASELLTIPKKFDILGTIWFIGSASSSASEGDSHAKDRVCCSETWSSSAASISTKRGSNYLTVGVGYCVWSMDQ